MVGSQSGGSFAQPNNEGYPGYFISQVHRRALAALPVYKPNIVTILVGTNDVGANLDAVNAPLRLTKMIQDVLAMDGEGAGVCVVVSTLPPNRDSRANGRIKSYNAALSDVVRDFVDAGRAVLLVDCHAVVGVEDLEDGTHPNDAAYERMARVFYDGIQEAFVKGWIFDVHASEA
ncbi:SGNH hydrolase-type esterase domain-containing protein [Favolaschia claudopus]|uniref:SGNH hydrolase-type esterase domain-containing protein n=1 Tax=Favolaschia claudopus TaxID=2862362 RepID=A0AAV9ZF26_9AGAR